MLVLTPRVSVRLDLVGVGSGRLSFSAPTTSVSFTLAPLVQGVPGPSGSVASISSEAGNGLTTGSDGGIFLSGAPLYIQDW